MSESSSEQVSKVVILADDLSGAAELAGIAFSHGLSAEVQREFEPDTNANVVAIDTDSRHLAPSAAAERVKQVTEQVLATRPAWIYKKVDSVLRGNVRAEIEAMLQLTGQSRALLIPANPSRGRTIVAGQYFIDGVPLDETDLAHDPHQPRWSSEVQALLGRSTGHKDQIHIPDVQNESQLRELAAQCSDQVLAAGAADFFAALLRRRVTSAVESSDNVPPLSLVAPAVLVCGSRAAWSLRREQCATDGVPIFAVSGGFGTGPSSFSNLLVGIDESEPIDSGILLSLLARLAKFLIKNKSPPTLLAEGGATATAIANEMNWLRFQVVATAPAGVGVLRPLAPSAPLFVIKPGSYPWPSEIWQSFCRC